MAQTLSGNKMRLNRSHLHRPDETDVQETETVNRIRFYSLGTRVTVHKDRMHKPVQIDLRCGLFFCLFFSRTE